MSTIDIVLNTQIENIGQNQLPKVTYFHEILHIDLLLFKQIEIHMVIRNYTFARKFGFIFKADFVNAN